MSQIQSFESSVVPPVGGPVLSLKGDAPLNLPVLPTLGNINIQGKTTSAFGFSKVNGDPGSSTLSIVPLSDTLTTLNAVPTVFVNAVFALSANEAVVFSANVIGNKSDYSAACGGYVTAVARRDAVNPTVLVGQSPLLSRDPGTSIFGIILDGNSIKVGVQGIAAETWNWTCTYQWTVQTA